MGANWTIILDQLIHENTDSDKFDCISFKQSRAERSVPAMAYGAYGAYEPVRVCPLWNQQDTAAPCKRFMGFYRVFSVWDF